MEDSGNAASRAKAIAGICLALGSYVLLAGLSHFGLLPKIPFLGVALDWLILVFVMLWAIKIEGLSLSSLGIKRPTFGTLGWSVLAVVATFLLLRIYYLVVAYTFGSSAPPAAVGMLKSQPMGGLFLICLTAGVVEEMVYRFYPMSRLLWLTSSKWIAMGIPIIIDVALHVPGFGLAQAIPVFLGTVVLTALYWFRRDCWCNALTHFLVDFASLGLAVIGGAA